MNNTIKILLAALLISAVFTRERICEHPVFGQAKTHNASASIQNKNSQTAKIITLADTNSDSGTRYRWDGQLHDWISTQNIKRNSTLLVSDSSLEIQTTKPIQLLWEDLINIEYELRYFSQFDMEMYAPLFPDHIKSLDGKAVSIEGYVIPFDDDEELISLSANPYASCFFCGQASPASVVSVLLKNRRKRYKIDDFKTFTGTLQLNYDDPDFFYYILRDAKEE